MLSQTQQPLGTGSAEAVESLAFSSLDRTVCCESLDKLHLGISVSLCRAVGLGEQIKQCGKTNTSKLKNGHSFEIMWEQ